MKLNWKNINQIFEDENLLNNFYMQYKPFLFKISSNENLTKAHLQKAKHNLLFFTKNQQDLNFKDWLIVILYYSLYHAVLALITNKNYKSTNHTASLIFIIKHYLNFKQEILLLYDLSIKKEDAQLYTQLKIDRHNASYQTNTQFSEEIINEYKIKVIKFINKVEKILMN